MAVVNGTNGADLLDGFGDAVTEGSDVIHGYGGDDIIYGLGGDDTIYGDLGADTIYGGAGNDYLSGDEDDGPGSLTDFLAGGAGNDTYYSDGFDNIDEAAPGSGGIDTVISTTSIYFTDGFNSAYFTGDIENIILIGTSGTYAYGNALNNTITGNVAANNLAGYGGNDVLNGLEGVDNMYGMDGNDALYSNTTNSGDDYLEGGAGNDTFYVDSNNDRVRDAVGQGVDRVVAKTTFFLHGSAEIEYLQTADASGTLGFALRGNDFSQSKTGNAGANAVYGLGGNDTLNGGGGNDTMYGGVGNDTFIVSATGDKTVELAGQGTDTVQSSINWTLGDNVERLLLIGAGNLNGTGNALNNTMAGNSGSNTLNGAGGDDYMVGGVGNDTFIVNSVSDQAIEAAGQGTDTVRSTISWTLGANIERLELLGTASVNGTGNALNNTIAGNAASNILNGAGGDDYMVGGAVNDIYYVSSTGDQTIEAAGGGTDTVRSYVNWTLAANVERLELLGAGNLNGVGNSLANTIAGTTGSNFINGAAGSDYLVGGAGNDTFFFNTALGTTNIDTIADYNVAQDTIRLENGIFTALVGTGTPTAAQFVKNASGTATDANDRIIYETDTGKLFYDSNGSAAGGQVQFAKLAAGLALTSSDFFIV
ncbi:calcium-binding protein [Mesorhizobium sp. DCY119]|uniref:beta strand repeat-containing protein n=1 Tax=Mesorhizobium sp. DCY119 TaxID=2108445 RepID=UPI000E70988B|nr:calcium-binding protein [Mesorhizobium sp. DCY119]RJG40803.1 calcium-binding protein [Mesorhizobium sp. DCY119]